MLRAMLLPLSNISVLLAIIIFRLLYQVAFLLRHVHVVLALEAARDCHNDELICFLR